MLSKLENQQTVPTYNEYRLDEQIRKSILALENKWTEKNIHFDIDFPPQTYYGCEQLLIQVWNNILDNAIKHSYQDGTIQVTLQNRKTDIIVQITDNGEGMNEEVQKHIFEKFYQGDSSRKAEGNGLGLSLTKRILDLCNGTIEVQSSLHQGATYIVKLCK